jgi:biofilm PGA synthesis N-glycosyltransferase PgaC
MYTLLIIRFLRGWNSIDEHKANGHFEDIFVSIIIAFRNEEKNLTPLFDSLQNQAYPVKSFEIIFCDDHSSDKSVEMVREFVVSRSNSKLIQLDSELTGKKKALEIASLEAKGKLLIFTDADCKAHKNWVSTIVSFYSKHKPVLIAGPVIITPLSGSFNKFQSLEFFSLIGSTAGSFGVQNPVMLNGANLAVEREAYYESIDSLENRSASGDDVFLLLNIKKKYPQKLMFLKSSEAIVSVNPSNTVLEYIQQRLRWVSKSKYYSDPAIIFTAIIVLLINFSILLCIFLSFFNILFAVVGLVLFSIKSIVDYVFLRKILKFFDQTSLLRVFVLSQILYFLYVSFTGIAGNFIPSNWKGRRVI